MIKLYGPDNKEMMTVASFHQDGDALLIKGMIYGTMPLTAKLHPEDARAIFKMLTPRLVWFLVTLPFRRRVKVARKP